MSMGNDSTTPGYLTPIGDAPAYDEALERLISRWIRGLTGLDKSVVLPQWTDPQPEIPKNGTTWCAFGVGIVQEDSYPAFVQQTDTSVQQWSFESIDLNCSFYGPQGLTTATQFRDGLQVAQNNAELNAVGMTFQDCSQLMNLPELINYQWVRRYDLHITLRRKIIRSYGVNSLLSAPVKFFGE